MSADHGKPSSIGIQGNHVTFSIAGRRYITSAITPEQARNLTVKEAQALIASGAAMAQYGSYLAQFPWTKPQPNK